MALVPVRHAQPINGEQPITEVSEEWLARWPEDFDRLEGEELARYELTKAGVPAAQLDEAVAASLALAQFELAPSEPATHDDAEADDALDATVAGDDETPAPAAS